MPYGTETEGRFKELVLPEFVQDTEINTAVLMKNTRGTLITTPGLGFWSQKMALPVAQCPLTATQKLLHTDSTVLLPIATCIFLGGFPPKY